MHPVISRGKVALITGGAGGIGLATAERLAAAGMVLVIADTDGEKLATVAKALEAAGAARVQAVPCDVADRAQVEALADRVARDMGGVDLLMANAAIQPGSALFDPVEVWDKVLGVNLWGVIHTIQAFVPAMIARGSEAAVVITGSKQGITSPPGDPAYNVAKSGVKTFAELTAHELRQAGAPISAHLLIPGFTFTGLTQADVKPEGAWTPGQVADFLIEGMAAGDFYILCPDNEVTRELDEKRMEWAMGDVIHNRPPLSRWHPDWGDRFKAFLENE